MLMWRFAVISHILCALLVLCCRINFCAAKRMTSHSFLFAPLYSYGDSMDFTFAGLSHTVSRVERTFAGGIVIRRISVTQMLAIFRDCNHVS